MTNRDRARKKLEDAIAWLGIPYSIEGLELFLDAIELMNAREKKAKEEIDTAPTWESYFSSFEVRYKTYPQRNAIVNNQIKQIVRRVGSEDAPVLMEFYLSLSDAFYMRVMHSVGQCLKDAETLAARMRGARKVSDKEAVKKESLQDTARSSAEYLKGKHR